ncbi:hypothetical protein ABT093_20120 [Kitasatospora sp. NPDC002551]|uniref:hypothetical protein n=1 Tax=Kitasatospora sp. NPDC002551 TaxID=3154539 RepID=UPI003319FF68
MEILDRVAVQRLGLDVPAVLRASAVLARGNSRQKWHIPLGASERTCSSMPAAARSEEVLLLDALPRLCSGCRVEIDAPTGALWRSCAMVVDAEAATVSLEKAADGEGASWSRYAVALSCSPLGRDGELRMLLGPLVGGELADQGGQVLSVWEQVLERWRAAAQRFREVLPPPLLSAAVTGAVDRVESAGAERRGAELDRLHGLRGGPAPLWRVASAAWGKALTIGAQPPAALAAALETVARTWSTYPIREVALLPTPAVTSAEGHDGPASWARAEADHHARAVVIRWCGLLDEALAEALTACEKPAQLVLVHGWPLTEASDSGLAFLSAWEQVGPTVPTPWLPGYARDGEDLGMRSAAVLAVPAAAAVIAQRVTASAFSGLGRGRVVLGPVIEQGHGPGTVGAMAAALLRTAFPLVPDDLAPQAPVSEVVARARGELAAAARPFPDCSRTDPVERLSLCAWPDLIGGLAWIPGTRHFDDLLATGFGGTLHVGRLVVQSGPGADGPLVVLGGELSRTPTAGIIEFTPPRGSTLRVPLNRIAAVLSRPVIEPGRGEPRVRLWAPWEGAFHALAGRHRPAGPTA